MTRNISLYAHDSSTPAWNTLVAEVEAALAKMRASEGGATAGGSVYDSHANPTSRNL